jgi:hypothetical protein
MKIVLWVLKRFWFPILIAIIGSMADKSPTLKKIHTTLKKFK